MRKFRSIPFLSIFSTVALSLISYTNATSTSSILSTVSSTIHAKQNKQSSLYSTRLNVRGGSTAVAPSSDDRKATISPDLKWRMQQQQLLQLRSTFFSEALAARGIPLTTMLEVSTLDGDKPPEEADWDCAISTEKDPKSCLYSFDAEPNTKVLAPKSTTQYISLIALNRLRRTDPTKVEPMWHSQYSILKSWFSEESPFSLLQHVGIKGFFVSTILLDWGNGLFLKGIVLGMLWMAWGLFLYPIVEYMGNRFLVSGLFWSFYGHWSKIAHAAFPLKLLLAQMGWKFAVGKLDSLTNFIRDYIVELECQILEESIPITVGGLDDDDMDFGAFDEDAESDLESDED